MRVVVFFDLPVATTEDRKSYRQFRKSLIKDGFLMLQESVYCKLALNQTAAGLIIERVRKNRPVQGIVQMLILTEKQFSRMEYVVGEYSGEVIDSDERLIVL